MDLGKFCFESNLWGEGGGGRGEGGGGRGEGGGGEGTQSRHSRGALIG